jgi:hypothetical protein
MEERNDTWQVHMHVPGFVAIGDNGGGKVILLKTDEEDKSVYIVDSGSMQPQYMTCIGVCLADWISAGGPVATEQEPVETATQLVDIYLERMPSDGLNGLVALKTALMVDISLAALKQGALHPPFVVVSGVPYGKYKQRCRHVNQAAEFLTIRMHRRPTEHLPIF